MGHTKMIMVLLALPAMLLVQCKHPTDQMDFIGPEFAPAPQGFKVKNNSFMAAFSVVDLSTEKQFFSADFSAKVQWHISLAGQQSGAIKTLSGISVSLTQGNSGWEGDSNNGYIFQQGEPVLATLYFLGDTLQLSDTFTLLKLKNGIGILIDDFEDSFRNQIRLDSLFLDTGDSSSINRKDSTRKLEGIYSLSLSGTDKNSDYWIAGIMSKKKIALDEKIFSSPEMLVVNLFIYGNGNAQTSLELEIWEDDDRSGDYSATKDDAFHSVIQVDWTGWRMISIPYVDFLNSAADGIGSGGNTKQPAHIIRTGLTLLSIPSGGAVSLYADYFTMSKKE